MRALEKPINSRVFAHRCGAGGAPENTLAAIRCVSKFDVQWVELDVRKSKDGTLILMHDKTLERTTNGNGSIQDVCISYLRTLDAGSWFSKKFSKEQIPTLEEAIHLILEVGISVNVEIKTSKNEDPKIGAQVAELLVKYWPMHLPLPIISSFSSGPLEEARRAVPELPRMLVGDVLWDGWYEELVRLDSHHININHKYLTQKMVRAVSEAGINVLCYTVNKPERAREVLEWGVDAVFSDNPERLLKYLIE